jgi:hypothetical protein
MKKPRKLTAAAARRAAKWRHKPHNLRRWEASAYLQDVHGLKYAPATLAKYAMWGTGPIFRYLDGWIPVYEPKDLDEWLKPSLGKPRRHTRKQPRDKAAAHQPTAEHNGSADKLSEQAPAPPLGTPTAQPLPRSYANRRRREPIAADPDVREECA